MIIFLDLKNNITKIQFLKNNETEEFLNHIEEEKLLNTWKKKPLNEIEKIKYDVIQELL